MDKLYSAAAGVFVATAIASAAQAEGPDIICATAAIGVEG